MKTEEKIRQIIEVVCQVFGVTEEQIKSKSRLRDYTEPRLAIVYIIGFYKLERITKIGEIVNRERTTYNHAIKTVPNLIDYDLRFQEKYNLVISKLLK